MLRSKLAGQLAADNYIPTDMETIATSAVRGRPREFDVEEALATALRVFWEKGYEGASLTDLTDAMGITRPSLYAAFGNKEALFKRALDLYESEKLAYVGAALSAPTARAVVQRMLEGTIDNITSDCPGCLGVIVSVSCGSTSSPIQEDVRARALSSRKAMIERIQRAIDEGDFTMPVEAEVMTQYLMTLMQGLAVQAGAGATRGELDQVAAAALAVWPSR
jgi:AcrR family transcriptional regulator